MLRFFSHYFSKYRRFAIFYANRAQFVETDKNQETPLFVLLLEPQCNRLFIRAGNGRRLWGSGAKVASSSERRQDFRALPMPI